MCDSGGTYPCHAIYAYQMEAERLQLHLARFRASGARFAKLKGVKTANCDVCSFGAYETATVAIAFLRIGMYLLSACGMMFWEQLGCLRAFF